jgi:trk system potassium uptake protein TrkA|tara:strand:- start:61 stop:1413 length:1353 start_codon:yes stop_codon:yes gene_type:complete
MKVVIIGGGEVGFHVAKALSEEDYDITVVDLDPVKCRRASENLDVIVVEGNGASPNTLNEARVGDADYVLCLTRVDEVNLIASQQAHKLGANKIIARLRNQQYTTQESIIRPEKFGVDVVIHPEKEACEEIMRLVNHPYAVQAMDFEAGRLTMLGLRIESSCEELKRDSLGKVAKNNSHFRFGVIAVLRGQETVVPSAEFKFKDGDIGYFIIKTEDIRNLLGLLNKDVTETHRVMIIGGSKIGRSLAKGLPNDSVNVRLVEYDRPKAGHISHSIDESMIIYGDGTDIEFLKSENIQDVDSFIAVTENEKTNLIAGLLAKHLGAKQSIIHVSNTEYIPTIQEIGAGAVISKNLSTVNSILRELHTDLTEIPVLTFDEIDVDVIEFQPEPNSPITQRPLKELNLPQDCIVGMINHHGKIRIAHGKSILTEDDTALVFAKPKATGKLKKLFSS